MGEIYSKHFWPDGEFTWLPSIPEPFWVRTPLWRRLLLREPAHKPGCCGQVFKDRAAYEEHYMVASEPHEMGFVKSKDRG